MKLTVPRLISSVIAVMVLSLAAFGQTSFSTLTGTVMDPTGAVVAGANVIAKNNDTAVEFRATTASNGTFSIPSLPPGTYTVTVSAPSFKQTVLSDVKVDVGAAGNVRVSLEVGATSETVTIQGGGEVLQSQSTNIATTLQVKQIAQLPLVSRNALDFMILMPGVNTPRSPRDSTINGLPQGTINITIDGLNTQDGNLRTDDGFFSYISPRLDAVEEVTLSTATPGADSGGQGAVQIKFVTRSGNNQFHGSLYEYHRNTALNANYWFSNRDLPALDKETGVACTTANYDPERCKAQRNKVLLNQFGGRIGGPIVLPKKFFGPLAFDGHDKAFFFINFEEFRLPNSTTRQRTIMTPDAQAGGFSYNRTVNGQVVVERRNVLDIARQNGLLSTPDPVVTQLLKDIRNTTTPAGLSNLADPNLQRFTFLSPSQQARYYPTMRLDFNVTSKHHLEGTWNYQSYLSSPDLLNSRDPIFPGFPNFGDQNSNRFSVATALRSTLKPTLVNEARFGFNGGTVLFSPQVNAGNFSGALANQAGFNLGISAFSSGGTAISNATNTAGISRRNSPRKDISDTLTWTRGAHSFSFGGSFTQVNQWQISQTVVPSITFGVDTTDTATRAIFSTTNFPGATTGTLDSARNLYAVLVGSVTAIGANAILNEETNQYSYNGARVQRGRMREWGFFGQDSWRMRPNLTLNYGLRYELQLPFTPLNSSYANVSIADLYGVSGAGNLFKPGTQTGRETRFVEYKQGLSAYNIDKNNFAPSLGFAWSVNAKNGWLKRIFGDSGQTVMRGGYSIAYNYEGMFEFSEVFSTNPGSSISATRSVANNNLGSLPLLLRETGRLGPPSFPSTPNYPLSGLPVVLQTNDAVTFDPNIQVPYTQSWSLGIQREITKNMAIEFRYVGNINLQQWVDYNLNSVEDNIYENGFLNEFKLAQSNLYANIAAGRCFGTQNPTANPGCQNNFRYFGPGSGTSPLPIILAYIGGAVAPGTATNYNSTLFADSTLVGRLARNNANPVGMSSDLWGNAGRRTNAINAGLPANFFQTNPGLDDVIFRGNGGYSRYDAMQIELRRRMSKGLLVQASYAWAKNFNGSRASFRIPRFNAPGGTLRHAFKASWQYEMPFGKGRMLLGNSSGVLGKLISDWEFQGTARIQSGEFHNFGSSRMFGMTEEELRDNFKLHFDDANRKVYILPQDILLNTRRAYSTSATDPTGYSSLGVPTGSYNAPASSEACTQIISGDCTNRSFLVQGPGFTRFDLSLIKKVKFNERANFEFRAEFLNAFNYVNFFVPNNVPLGTGATIGEVTEGYRDINNTQDPGGRLIQFVFRINF